VTAQAILKYTNSKNLLQISPQFTELQTTAKYRHIVGDIKLT